MTEGIKMHSRSTFRRLIGYFFKGLLILIPVAGTLYLIFSLLTFLDNLFYVKHVPGLGILIILVGTTLVGYFGSGLFTKPFFDMFDDFLEKTPGVKFIYSSIKDVLEAFVGDKKKFTEPVMVEMTETGVMRIGFVVNRDLDKIQANGYVAVYFPISYSLAGNVYLVPLNRIKPIDGNSTHLMKFIVSGGLTGL